MTSSLRLFEPGEPDWRHQRGALIITHPGHELFVHGWLENARPLVFVLTDCPGCGGWPLHLHSTARVLRRAGARIGSIYGRFTNAALYGAVRDGEHGRFLALAEELADELARERIDYVVGDAAEGHDIGHDACRLLIDAAVVRAARQRPGLRSYELSLNRPHAECPLDMIQQSLWMHLDSDSWRRKHDAACGHPELAGEIDLAAERFGLDSLKVECLRPTLPWSANEEHTLSARPAWTNGASFRDHFVPLAEYLRIASSRTGRAAA
jgi:hypothetical protein